MKLRASSVSMHGVVGALPMQDLLGNTLQHRTGLENESREYDAAQVGTWPEL